jgi:release factor glutamine methyltransferase
MNKEELFNILKRDLAGNLNLLDDKPAETIDSSLKALWHAASGFPMPVEKAEKLLLPDLTGQQVIKLEGLVEQRLKNIPLAYITGRQSFMNIELLSDRRALIPRKETEILGRKALELSLSISKRKHTVNIIDVCCGAGNLGVALAYYNRNAFVFASDLSKDAVDLARDNINFLDLNDRVSATQGDLFSAFETVEFYEKTDLIVCNPPYISSAKVLKMTAEISDNEPSLAFDGGMLGTKIILKLISEAHRFLVKEGWLILEVGVGQGPFIAQLCERSEYYTTIESVEDDSGNIRVILAEKA